MADTRKNTPITFIVPGQLQAAAQAGATRGGPSAGADVYKRQAWAWARPVLARASVVASTARV